MSRKPRAVSGEDEALFFAALKDAKPLKSRPRRTAEPKRPTGVIVAPPPVPRQPSYNERPARAIGGHTDAHLRRGRIDPEARIDLHGLSHDHAYRALLGFLWRGQADGHSLVLVITGKGSVLRKNVPLWLGQSELKGLVAGVSDAHVKHGGGGAFYVALRKRKGPRTAP